MTTGIPTTPKRFKNWRDKQGPMPAELSHAAHVHYLDLAMLALNKGHPDYAAIKKSAQPRMDKFRAACSKWLATK